MTPELTHWTKHERRLARDFGRMRHGDEGYAREKLVAELGSAFLCADLCITPEVRERPCEKWTIPLAVGLEGPFAPTCCRWQDFPYCL